MIGDEVEVRGKEQGDGHVVEAVRGEGVARFQDAVEVVRVPIVADETEHCNPKIGLEGVSASGASNSVE